MSTFQEILDAVRTLAPADRLRLVEALWDDASPAEWPAPSQEWIAEAQRRSAEYDQGRMSATPWSEARARARRKARVDG